MKGSSGRRSGSRRDIDRDAYALLNVIMLRINGRIRAEGNRFSSPPFLHFINISYQTLLTGGFGYRGPPVPSLYGRHAGDPERKSRIMQKFLLQR